jgi:hypothetical protein
MSWAKPLLNPQAHEGGLNLDLLAARLEADINEGPPDAELGREMGNGGRG